MMILMILQIIHYKFLNKYKMGILYLYKVSNGIKYKNFAVFYNSISKHNFILSKYQNIIKIDKIIIDKKIIDFLYTIDIHKKFHLLKIGDCLYLFDNKNENVFEIKNNLNNIENIYKKVYLELN